MQFPAYSPLNTAAGATFTALITGIRLPASVINDTEDSPPGGERDRVAGLDAEQQRLHSAPRCIRQRNAGDHAAECQQRHPGRTTRLTIAPRCAPSAMRTPISCLRVDTEYARSP